MFGTGGDRGCSKEIYIDFAPADWNLANPRPGRPRMSLEYNQQTQRWESKRIMSLADPERAWGSTPSYLLEAVLFDRMVHISIMVHELIHLLLGHNDSGRRYAVPGSIAKRCWRPTAGWTRAIRLRNVDCTSFHIPGRGGQGMGWSNRASGPTPWTNLEDNPVLLGTAKERCAVRHVAGNGNGRRSPGRRTGDARRATRLHQPGAVGSKAAPGSMGTGMMWGDGDLGYAIEVRGNTFVQTGARSPARRCTKRWAGW